MKKESKTVGHIRKTFFNLSENWIYTQIKYLIDWKVLVLTEETKNLDLIGDIPDSFVRRKDLSTSIRRLDSGFYHLFNFYPSYYYHSKRKDVSLLHAHFGHTGYYFLKLAKTLKVPLITTFYGFDLSLIPKREPGWITRYQQLFKDGDLFLVEGSAMKRQLIDVGCPKEKIKIQHLGVETENFKPRQQYPNDVQLKILMAGRFVEKKGFIYGLKALKKIIEDGKKATMTIIGDSTGIKRSEKVAKNLKEYVRTRHLQEFVTFRGMVPLQELRAAYYKHDVFLSPSVQAQNGDNEGGAPVSIIEASATGMPVVSTFHCDIPEVVKHKKTGFLCKERDHHCIAEYLKDLQAHRNSIKKMGQRAATHIKEQYNAKVQGEKLSEIYRNVLA